MMHNSRTILLCSFFFLALQCAQAQPDDIFHCQDPKNVDKKTQLKCDKNTFEWKLDDLDPQEPPEICGVDYIEQGQPESMPADGEIEDALEPCLLWSIFFGSLNSPMPTLFPTTPPSTSPSGPTNPPTTEDGEDGSFFNPTTPAPQNPVTTVAPVVPITSAPAVPTVPPTDLPSASPTPMDPTRLALDAFTLTFSWPPSMELNIFNGPDRLELYDITLQHLETSLRAELNGVPIDKIELSMQTAVTSNRLVTTAQGSSGKTWTELVTGFVQFGIPAPIDSSTLQTLVADTFSGSALDVYEFRLQLANDEVLKMIAKVSMGSEGVNGGGGASNDEDLTTTPGQGSGSGVNSGSGGLTWSPLLIAIVVCVVVGVIMACVFAYFLLYGRRRSRKSRQAKAVEHPTRDFPELQTDPTPPSDGDAAGLEYHNNTAEDYHHQQQQEYYDEQEPVPRYPSTLPTPDGITMDEHQNLTQPYLLNPVESVAGSSLPTDGDTFYDMENQSLAPSLYSYRDQEAGNGSYHWDAQKQQAAPPPPPSTSLSAAKPPTAVKDKGSPSKKSGAAAAAAGGLLGGIVGKYYTGKKNNKDAPQDNDASSSEDEYGFEKEANPSKDDESLLRVDTATAASKTEDGNNSTSPSYMDDRSLISDGRVGQILGDVHSIQGDGGPESSPQNFDDIWNDDDSEGELKSTKSTITDPDGTEQDVGDVLNVSTGSKPFDELQDKTQQQDRPFDEERIEQRDIVIPDIPVRSMNRQETEKWSNSNSNNGQQRNGNDQILPPLEDDEVSQLDEDDDLLLLNNPTMSNMTDTNESKQPMLDSPVSTKDEVAPEKVEEESVEDYSHNNAANNSKTQDDSTHEGSASMLMDERSIAEDSYGFADTSYKPPPPPPPPAKSPSPNKLNDDNVKLALPQNLKQAQVVDSIPGSNQVVLSTSGSGDDQSIEAVSLVSDTASGTSPNKTSSGLSSNIKSLAAKPRQLVKGMSVRRKKNSDWATSTSSSSPAKDPVVPRPISPTPSVESTDSAAFRALMNEPNVFDTPVGTPDDATPKPAVEDTQRNGPAPLLHRLPSDSDDDDCYLEDQPVIPYPAGVLPKTAYEEKKDDDSNSVVFSLDEVTSDA